MPLGNVQIFALPFDPAGIFRWGRSLIPPPRGASAMFLGAHLTTWCTGSNRHGDVFKQPQSRRTK